MPVSVNSIAVIRPDLLAVEVLDSPWTKGTLEQFDASLQSYNSWFSHNSSFALPIGPDKDWIKYQDTHDGGYLDKDAAEVSGNYGTVGGRTVTAVYRKTDAYDQGTYSIATYGRGVSMRHILLLPLDGDLAEGDHTIDFPVATGLADYPFTYDTHNTRHLAIHVNQHGHRVTDSKYAYLSFWLDGVVLDLPTDLGVSTFDVIDEFGNQVFTGSIDARVGPDDAEAGYNISDVAVGTPDKQRYVSGAVPTATIVDITPGATTTIEYAGADVLTDGGIISLSAIVGLSAPTGETLNNNSNIQFYKSANLNAGANTFELQTVADGPVDTSAWTDTYVGPGGNIYSSWVSNTTGTYVYGMDYSAFQPTNGGTYRLRIPGVGVSEPFRIDEAVYYKATEIFAEAEYALRSGSLCDGRFGYTRPITFKSGSSGQTIYRANLPYIFTDEFLSGGVSQVKGAIDDYRTATEETDLWGSFMDAGDWDTRLPQMLDVMYMMMVVYGEMSQVKQRALDYNLPKSSELLDSGLYSGLDVEGDLLHSVIWLTDCYRRGQHANGSVSAGLNVGSADATTDIEEGEPSWLSRHTLFAYLPDHISTFGYAGLAAKLANLLGDLGHTSLATTYQTSAELAWTWAESIYQNTGSARDTHYATFKAAVQTESGWSNATYDAHMATVQSQAAAYRNFAAACLFSLTGTTAYKTAVETAWPFDTGGIEGQAAYEHGNAVGATPSTASSMLAALVTRADNNIVGWRNSDVGYRSIGFTGISLSFGEKSGSWNERPSNLILAHLINGDAKYINTLQDGFSHIWGANQTDRSWTTGIGSKQVTGVLHRDAEYSAQPMPNGLTIYGPNRFGGGVKALNMAGGFLNFIKWDGSAGTSPDEDHVPKPHWLGWPVNEALFQNSYMIEHMEFTAQQSLFPQFYTAAYLDHLGGNTQTEYETYTGAPNMLVELVNGNEIRTNGSLIKATNLHFGATLSVWGVDVILAEVDRAVNVP